MSDKLQSILGGLHRSSSTGAAPSHRALTQMLYLVDWKHTLVHGSPMTNLAWRFGISGPEAEGLVLAGPDSQAGARLTTAETSIIDFVVRAARDKTDVELTRLVYSTYPMVTGQRHSILDMPASAAAYGAMVDKMESNEKATGQA